MNHRNAEGRPRQVSGPMISETMATSTNRIARLETAGVVLRAAEALANPQSMWTEEQVCYVVALAFESGMHAALDERLADVRTCWLEGLMREKAAFGRAQRRAYYDGQYAKINEKLGRPAGYRYNGGPVDWATGRPVRHLQAVAA